MTNRLQAASPEDYFAKLLACRTSPNGVFGMKVHFRHFEMALSWYPSMLGVLSPVTYIYVNRRDKLAQAVSMAMAMQTDAWTSMDSAAEITLRYDEAFITQCLEDIQQQRLGWLRWFEMNNITPFVVNYEDLVSDKAGAIRRVVELLDVAQDGPEEVRLPATRKQGDGTNIEWAARFRREADRRTEPDDRHVEIVSDWEAWFPASEP
jgi:LPS sulfotransferase NodH